MGCASSSADMACVVPPKGVREKSEFPVVKLQHRDAAKAFGRVGNMHVFQAKYVVGDLLGQGSFGSVHSVQKQGMASEKLAAKFLSWNEDDNTRYNKACREAEMWQLVSNQRGPMDFAVLKLQDAFMNFNSCVFVMESCSHSLWEYIVDCRNPSEAFCGDVFGQMLAGLAHVHSCDIVHRDVKPSNFLVLRDTIKLIDFGLAEAMTPCGLLGEVGTAPYMSPEMLHKCAYDAATDIWSLGAMAYAMLCGCFPHMPTTLSPSHMKKAIRENNPEPAFASTTGCAAISEKAQSFLRAALTRDAERRPAASELMGHNFVQDTDACTDLTQSFMGAYACGAFT